MRFGAVSIAMCGLALLSGAALAGLHGITFGHFAINLVLLGLGWNFGFIGGTTLLTSCYRPEEREKVQALNDFVVFGQWPHCAPAESGRRAHREWPATARVGAQV
jgi:hypothetical protein